jgi:hypothetical protein
VRLLPCRAAADYGSGVVDCPATRARGIAVGGDATPNSGRYALPGPFRATLAPFNSVTPR